MLLITPLIMNLNFVCVIFSVCKQLMLIFLSKIVKDTKRIFFNSGWNINRTKFKLIWGKIYLTNHLYVVFQGGGARDTQMINQFIETHREDFKDFFLILDVEDLFFYFGPHIFNAYVYKVILELNSINVYIYIPLKAF